MKSKETRRNMPIFVRSIAQWNTRAVLSMILIFALFGCSNALPATNKPMAAATSTPTALPLYSRLFSTHYQVTFRPDVAYGRLSQEILDLCIPTGLPTPRPGLVLIHAGGWFTGDKRETFDQEQDNLQSTCMGLASQGFLVASINYRLTPGATWPTQLVDAQLAVRWLRAHADTFGLDPRHICAAGLSAGAHLAVFLGVLQATHQGDEAELLATTSPRISCVVDFFGPVDLIQLVKTSPNTLPEVRDLLGQVKLESNPALYRAASPLFFVSSQSAPMLIIHGIQDTDVPVSQSLALQHSLQQQHVPVKYIGYEGDHLFGGLNEQQIRDIWAQVLAYLAAQEKVQ
jgi:acetyl esterase/lipase